MVPRKFDLNRFTKEAEATVTLWPIPYGATCTYVFYNTTQTFTLLLYNLH